MSAIECALFGTLGRDAESKTSKTGKPYLRLNVACETGEQTTWVSVMAFDPRAIENAAGFVKSARVYVEGKLSLGEWTAPDGTPRQGLSVMSWHCRLANIGRAKPARKKKADDSGAVPAPNNGTAFDDPLPF